MIIIAWIAIGVMLFVSAVVILSFIFGCNAYDGRIDKLESWQKRAEKGLDELFKEKQK